MMNSIEKAKEIVLKSGNNFHCQVSTYLKEKGWEILISPYYTDNITDKPREVDLIAEKAFRHQYWDHSLSPIDINVQLFIECKYIPSEVVFWFHDMEKSKVVNLLYRNTRLKYFKKDSLLTSESRHHHHYLNSKNDERVAKLFATSSQKGGEGESFYKALNQILNAYVYRHWDKTIIPEEKLKSRPNSKKTIKYPVIICNSFDKIFKVNIGDNSDPEGIDKNFLLEVNYAYVDGNKKPKNEYFLIDIVNFEKIGEFLGDIERDSKIIASVV